MISEHLIVLGFGLFVLSFISGMLGLGVAFAAVPFLSFFLPDLVHQVQPLALLLNGFTALFSTFGFAKSGHIDWKKAIILSMVTTPFAVVGAYLAHIISVMVIWVVYFLSVMYLSYRLFRPVKAVKKKKNFKVAFILAIPTSILSGFLGVGPGFLLMPTLILTGFDPKMAAGINAFAVTPPSFSALIPHIYTAKWDYFLTVTLIVIGVTSSFIGARFTSLYVSGNRLKQLFGVLIVVMTAYKIYTLLVGG